jgi:hypothetical protein
MKGGHETKPPASAAAPAVEHFDPFSQTLFEDRRHFPSSRREQFSRSRDIDWAPVRFPGFAQPDDTSATDGAAA